MYREVTISDKTNRVIRQALPDLQEKASLIAADTYSNLCQSSSKRQRRLKRLYLNGYNNFQVEAFSYLLSDFAHYFDNLGLIADKIDFIIKKNRSIGVPASDYQLLHNSFLDALRKNLPCRLDHSELNEWSNAFWYIANMLIELQESGKREKLEYNHRLETFAKFKVHQKKYLSHDTILLTARRCDLKNLPALEPGQYVSVYFPGMPALRQYYVIPSRSSQFISFAVKNIGIISKYLDEHIEKGSDLLISKPTGGFKVGCFSAADIAIFSGGIGVTSHISLLSTLNNEKYQGRIDHFICVKNGLGNAFKSLLQRHTSNLNIRNHLVLSNPNHGDIKTANFDYSYRLDKEFISSNLAFSKIRTRKYFISGPAGFMSHINQLMQEFGVHKNDLHFEFFGPSIQLNEVPKQVTYWQALAT